MLDFDELKEMFEDEHIELLRLSQEEEDTKEYLVDVQRRLKFVKEKRDAISVMMRIADCQAWRDAMGIDPRAVKKEEEPRFNREISQEEI